MTREADILDRTDLLLTIAEENRALCEACPAMAYKPHDHGQLQFHQSTHQIRCLFPGTGFGKTMALAAEFDAWARHTNRWRKTPPWPVRMLWFAKSESQWDLIRPQLVEEVFGRVPQYHAGSRTFEWRDGSFMKAGFADDANSWEKWQGPNPDLVGFDEKPQPQHFREQLARDRGKRSTNLAIAATATTGISWMHKLLYLPWKEHHEKEGIDTQKALMVQSHPRIWVWDRGGIDDNPGASEQQRANARLNPWGSAKELKVRLFGGFEDWVGDPVFDPDALEKMRNLARTMNAEQPWKTGRLVVK